MAFADIYRGRSVFVTGHTGFKGAWLCEWLLALGARVTGYALPPPTQPSLFEQLHLADRLSHAQGDVRDLADLRGAIEAAAPDWIFHLAAQPLVRQSYVDPVETYSTNVMGTVNLLEAVRAIGRPCLVVIITTDKCYENSELRRAFVEDDPLGGHDPYSSSKAAVELVVSAYRRSFFQPASTIRIASARAGNVIGGGDWAADRIVPDCVRALQEGREILVRNPASTRPWQHVLEPLSGYLLLGAKLAAQTTGSQADEMASAFNFGPPSDSSHSVKDLVEGALHHWSGRWNVYSDPHEVHEAGHLQLSTAKARRLLSWEPIWSFKETVAHTMIWYREHHAGRQSVSALTSDQIIRFTHDAQARGIGWSM